MLATERCYLQVEGRIVNEDKRVGSFRKQRFTGDPEIGLYILPVPQHLRPSHKSHMPYMPEELTPGFCHGITTQSGKGRFRVTPLYLLDQFSSMLIPGCLSCYDEITANGEWLMAIV